jgi:hypothetical protein
MAVIAVLDAAGIVPLGLATEIQQLAGEAGH